MKYHVELSQGAARRTVEVDVGPGGLRVDGRPVEARLLAVGATPLRHLELDGRVHELVAMRADGAGRWRIAVGDARLDVAVADERVRSLAALAHRPAASGAGAVTAPMPGLVVRVSVREGDRVEAGAGLVVVEAMKMENQLAAAGPARVRRVLVVPGQTVEKGERLLELDAP